MSLNRAQQMREGRRQGIAVLWVLFVLALLSAVIGLTLREFYANRGFLSQRQKRLQTDWLARAGIELAAVRLLEADKPSKTDVKDLVANSLVHIEVTAAPGSSDTFLVTSDARFPTNEPHPVTRKQTRRVRRVADKGLVRLEAVIEADPAAKD